MFHISLLQILTGGYRHFKQIGRSEALRPVVVHVYSDRKMFLKTP